MKRNGNALDTLLRCVGLALAFGTLAGCGGGGGGNGGTTDAPLVLGATRLDFAANDVEKWFSVQCRGGQWSASTPTPFLTLTESHVAGNERLTVRVNWAALASGTHTGSIVVTGAGKTITLPVSVVVAAAEIIIDNRDPRFSIVSGNWGTADADNGNGCYGPDFRYHEANRTEIGRARFATTNVPAGSYEVWVYWSADPDRTTAQPIIVHDAAGVNTTYHVNLQQHGNQWFRLGTGRHLFAPTGCYIEFNTDTAAGYCNADAVRLVR